MSKIGEVSEIPREVIFEWKIKEFFSLSKEINTRYDSPKFYYSGASWVLWIFPNGQTHNNTDGWISLYLMRTSAGSPVTLNYSFALKSVDEKTDSEINFNCTFPSRYFRTGVRGFINREKLMEKKSDLAPTNDLTIICTLKNTEPNRVARSLFQRHQDICDNLCEIYVKAKKTDFKMKFSEGEIFAHQLILETRSSVFATMLSHDTKETKKGEVSMNDIDRGTMNNLLLYMYSGDIKNPTKENAFSLYATAEKYDLKDVQYICLDVIIRNLSVEWVCDVIKFAEQYEEQEVSRRAREYFKENAKKILESENWKTFAKENHDLGVELLGSLVQKLLPKRKSTNE